MNQKELRELIEFLIEKDIAEFELERGDVKVKVKRGVAAMVSVPAPQAAPMPSAAAGRVELTGAATSAKAAGGQLEEGLHIVKSPIVGTFYESPSPGSPPFAKPGDAVENGQILCIIEAMKLMNEIEADMSGELVKQLVTNGQPVEYGQSLFAIRPR